MWIIKNRVAFYILSGLLLGLSVLALAIWGVKPGVDFSGGSVLEVNFTENNPGKTVVVEKIDSLKLDLGDYSVRETGNSGYIVRLKSIDEAEKGQIVGSLETLGKMEEKRFNTIGPVLGAELRNKAIMSFVLVLILITLFIAYAFRHVSKPVSSWKYGYVAILTLLHDMLIPIGVFSVMGHFYGVEVDTLFIVAILVILGYSINDTIIVFDRIRENLSKVRDDERNEKFEEVVGAGLKQTIGRSVNTSFTTLLSLLAIYFIGGEVTKYFALALIIGVIAGAYSSIFFASPVLVSIKNRQDRKAAELKAELKAGK